MKKLIAILTVLSILCATFAVFAEETTEFTFRNNVQFGMSAQEVIDSEGNAFFERDVEHTRGPVNYDELQYENIVIPEENVMADLHYLFAGDKLVAIRLEYETRNISYEALKAGLSKDFGEAGPLDQALIGDKIFALDDEGRPERNTVAWVSGSVMIVLELDDDGEDMTVTFIDLNA